MNKVSLINEAIQAREHAYVPYSTFPVGASVRTKSGKVYTGCNIENSSYPVSLCAERVAIFKAISEGERDFEAIAVAADTKRPVPPCGACRQVMSEFFTKDTLIHLTNVERNSETFTLEELLPYSFTEDDLQGK